MNNKEMVEYKEPFISRIKKFFKNLFNKEQLYTDTKKVSNDPEQKIKMKKNENDFFNDIKVNGIEKNDVYKKKAFLDEINENPEALNMLSIDRLKKLEEYYDDIIKQNDEKIKKMQN